MLGELDFSPANEKTTNISLQSLRRNYPNNKMTIHL